MINNETHSTNIATHMHSQKLKAKLHFLLLLPRCCWRRLPNFVLFQFEIFPKMMKMNVAYCTLHHSLILLCISFSLYLSPFLSITGLGFVWWVVFGTFKRGRERGYISISQSSFTSHDSNSNNSTFDSDKFTFGFGFEFRMLYVIRTQNNCWSEKNREKNNNRIVNMVFDIFINSIVHAIMTTATAVAAAGARAEVAGTAHDNNNCECVRVWVSYSYNKLSFELSRECDLPANNASKHHIHKRIFELQLYQRAEAISLLLLFFVRLAYDSNFDFVVVARFFLEGRRSRRWGCGDSVALEIIIVITHWESIFCVDCEIYLIWFNRVCSRVLDGNRLHAVCHINICTRVKMYQSPSVLQTLWYNRNYIFFNLHRPCKQFHFDFLLSILFDKRNYCLFLPSHSWHGQIYMRTKSWETFSYLMSCYADIRSFWDGCSI